MKRAQNFIVMAVTLWVAACFQGVAPKLAIGPATPDLLLVAVIVLSLHADRKGGAILGFVGGFVHAALASASMGYYVVSRSITGFLTAWSRDIRFEHSWWLVFLTAFIATFFALAIQLFLPPARTISPFATATILTATYNGVLAMPLYALLNKLLAPVRL